MNNFINIPFGEQKIKIGIYSGEVFLENKNTSLRVMTTKPIHKYRDDLLKERNEFFKHIEFLKLISDGEILKATVGWDGRLFFNVYDKATINQFRCPPVRTYSYWKNRKRGRIYWYEDDMKKPIMTWMII